MDIIIKPLCFPHNAKIQNEKGILRPHFAKDLNARQPPITAAQWLCLTQFLEILMLSSSIKHDLSSAFDSDRNDDGLMNDQDINKDFNLKND